MDNYAGVTMLGGKILLPYVPLATFSEGLRIGQVPVEWNWGEPFELKGPLAEYRARNLQRMETDAKTKGQVFFDGPLVRLKNYFPNEDKKQLQLVLQETNFSSHTASNKTLEMPIDELGGETIKEHYRLQNPREVDDVLANPIGVNVAFLTTDDYAIILERSPKLAQYPGLWGVPAGFMNPNDISPYKTASRDAAIEEVGRKLAEAKLTELGRALDDFHYEILMTGVVDGTRAQVLSSPKSGEWEAKGRHIIPFNPRDCAQYLAKTITEIPSSVPESAWAVGRSPKWVPAHWRALYLALVFDKRYGQDDVENEIGKALNDR